MYQKSLKIQLYDDVRHEEKVFPLDSIVYSCNFQPSYIYLL